MKKIVALRRDENVRRIQNRRSLGWINEQKKRTCSVRPLNRQRGWRSRLVGTFLRHKHSMAVGVADFKHPLRYTMV